LSGKWSWEGQEPKAPRGTDNIKAAGPEGSACRTIQELTGAGGQAKGFFRETEKKFGSKKTENEQDGTARPLGNGNTGTIPRSTKDSKAEENPRNNYPELVRKNDKRGIARGGVSKRNA